MVMQKLARFIVKYRLIFFILFVALTAYSVVCIPKIQVEYDITAYLPQNTDTAKALEIMDDEFVTYGSATVLLKNVEYDAAAALCEKIRAVDGVKSLPFDNSSQYYKDGYAKLAISFFGTDDARSVAAYETAVRLLGESGCEYAVPAPLVDNYAETLANEMVIIIAIAAAVIIAVLLFTSKSFAEVLAFPVIFAVAAALNMGTNYWFGKISFVSNTVCIILQLALAIDYAIILCHRFTEEKERRGTDLESAMTAALAKAIPEISSSSLTTVSGLVALMFMQLRLGLDLGAVLAKSIVCSLLTVFFLMPFVLILLSKLMDKSRHRNLVPKIRFWGGGAVKARYAIAAAFAALLATGAWLSGGLEYVYSSDAIDTSRPTATRQAKEEMQSVFGYDNLLVILMPNDGDYDLQRAVQAAVTEEEIVDSAVGFAGIRIADGLYLTDGVTSAQFAELAGVDGGTATLLFFAYARSVGDRWSAAYEIPLTSLVDYLAENADGFGLDADKKLLIAALKTQLDEGRAQLVGERYVRIVCNVAADTEDAAAFALIDRLSPKIKALCPQAIFAGQSVSSYDLDGSFSSDNILISLLTVIFIYVILAFTFRSWGIPLVLVTVIQGAIFMNFALPALMGRNLFFFTYLIVSAIQMGATIDYAILITNRFRALKSTRDRREAIVAAVSGAFPTVFTSGSIMSVASFLVGGLTSDPMIASIGMTLGTGTLISIACVMTALPALLYMLDPVLEKTTFKRKRRAKDIRLPNPSELLADSLDD